MKYSYAVAALAETNGKPTHQDSGLKTGLLSNLLAFRKRRKPLKPNRYLTECLPAIAERLNARGGQVLKAPTGSGKSTLVVDLARTRRVWVIAPTKVLGTQYVDTAKAAGIECSQLDGNTDRYDREAAVRHDRLTVCTVQQFAKAHQHRLIMPTDLVLLDELSYAFRWMDSPQWQKPLRYVYDLLAAGKMNAMDATPPECLIRALGLESFSITPKHHTPRTLTIRRVREGEYNPEKIALAAIHQSKATGKLCVLQIKDTARLESLKSHAESHGLRCVVATSETWETDECQTLRNGQTEGLDVLLCTNVLEVGKSLYAPEREAEIHLIDKTALPREFVQFAARLRTFQSLECYHYVSAKRTPKATNYDTAYRELLANVNAIAKSMNSTTGLNVDGVELRNYTGKHATDFIREQDGAYAPCKATIAHYLEREHFQNLSADQFATELQTYTRDQIHLTDWQPPEGLDTEAKAIREQAKSAKADARQAVADALTETPELAHAGLAELWQGHKAGELFESYTAKQRAAGRQLLKACGAHRIKGYLQQLCSVLTVLFLLQKHRIAGAHTLDAAEVLAVLSLTEPKHLRELQTELHTLALHELPTAELSTKERHRRLHLEGKLKRLDRLAGEWHTLEALKTEWNKYRQKGSALAKAERITSPRKAREILSCYYVLDERRTHGSKRKEYRIVRRKTLADTLQNHGLIPQNSPVQVSDREPHTERTQSARYEPESVHRNPYNNTLTE